MDDLPYLAEDVRMAGYRSAVNEKEGTIRLEGDTGTPPKKQDITSWQLVKKVWEGRGYVVYTSMSSQMRYS